MVTFPDIRNTAPVTGNYRTCHRELPHLSQGTTAPVTGNYRTCHRELPHKEHTRQMIPSDMIQSRPDYLYQGRASPQQTNYIHLLLPRELTFCTNAIHRWSVAPHLETPQLNTILRPELQDMGHLSPQRSLLVKFTNANLSG